MRKEKNVKFWNCVEEIFAVQQFLQFSFPSFTLNLTTLAGFVFHFVRSPLLISEHFSWVDPSTQQHTLHTLIESESESTWREIVLVFSCSCSQAKARVSQRTARANERNIQPTNESRFTTKKIRFSSIILTLTTSHEIPIPRLESQPHHSASSGGKQSGKEWSEEEIRDEKKRKISKRTLNKL